jgi:hypothetical protein
MKRQTAASFICPIVSAKYPSFQKKSSYKKFAILDKKIQNFLSMEYM